MSEEPTTDAAQAEAPVQQLPANTETKPPEQKPPEPKRDENGQFMPGASGNPDGRPPGKGSVSLLKLLRDKLEEVPPGEQKNYAQIIIDVIMSKAIVQQDVKMLQDILNRIDGKPLNRTDLTSGGKPIEQNAITFVNFKDVTEG